MKKLTGFAVLAFLMVPMVAGAQLGTVGDLIDDIGDIVGAATPIVVGIALLAFFWGLARYIFAAGNEDARDQGRRIMIGGIIALFVMVSIWGLVRFIGEALGVSQEETPVAIPGVL